jgi:hypothetical protein
MTTPILVSLALLVASALLHVPLLVAVLDGVAWALRRADGPISRARQAGLILAMLGVVVGSHLAQVALWARALVALGVLGDLGTAFHASLGFYTSVGPEPVVMPPGWHPIGPFETLTGLLMTGLSTAVAFAVVHRLMHARLARLAPALLDQLP